MLDGKQTCFLLWGGDTISIFFGFLYTKMLERVVPKRSSWCLHSQELQKRETHTKESHNMEVFLSVEWVWSFPQILQGIWELKVCLSNSNSLSRCWHVWGHQRVNTKEAKDTWGIFMTEAPHCPRIRAFMWLILNWNTVHRWHPGPCAWETGLRALASGRNVNRVRAESEGFLLEKDITNCYDAYWNDLVHKNINSFLRLDIHCYEFFDVSYI